MKTSADKFRYQVKLLLVFGVMATAWGVIHLALDFYDVDHNPRRFDLGTTVAFAAYVLSHQLPIDMTIPKAKSRLTPAHIPLQTLKPRLRMAIVSAQHMEKMGSWIRASSAKKE